MAALQNLHLRLILKSRDPLVDDVSINLSYFTTFTTQDLTDVSQLAAAVTAAFSSTAGGITNAPNVYLSGVLDKGTNKALWQVYDVSNHLNGTPAGSPVLIGSWTIGGSSNNTATPEGCAVGITLQAPYGTDVEFAGNTRPRARDRGRIYFGPLSNFALGVDATTNRCVVPSATRSDLTKFVKNINVLTTAAHTVVWNLGVWSRKNAAMKSLQETWIDDRPDYQRLRTDQSGTKTILGLP